MDLIVLIIVSMLDFDLSIKGMQGNTEVAGCSSYRASSSIQAKYGTILEGLNSEVVCQSGRSLTKVPCFHKDIISYIFEQSMLIFKLMYLNMPIGDCNFWKGTSCDELPSDFVF